MLKTLIPMYLLPIDLIFHSLYTKSFELIILCLVSREIDLLRDAAAPPSFVTCPVSFDAARSKEDEKILKIQVSNSPNIKFLIPGGCALMWCGGFSINNSIIISDFSI